MAADRLKCRRIESIVNPTRVAGIATIGDQPGPAQDPQMARDGTVRQFEEIANQMTDAELAARQKRNDGQPMLVTQNLQEVNKWRDIRPWRQLGHDRQHAHVRTLYSSSR